MQFFYYILILLFASLFSQNILVAKEIPKITQTWQEPNLKQIPAGKEGELIRYGIEILSQTSSITGPYAPDKKLRYSRNNLNCINCHEGGHSKLPGTKPYSIPFINVINEYPKLDIKTGKTISLEDRVRGMFGQGEEIIQNDSKEMRAILGYFTWLNNTVKAKEPIKGTSLLKLNPISRAADPIRGKIIYQKQCASCHGIEGLGIKNSEFNQGAGYLYPPLAGNDTYDDNGHMYLIPTLAAFIYANMPLGSTYKNPTLTQEQSYDVAAYINSDLPRLHNPNIKFSYPNPNFRPQGFAPSEQFSEDEQAAYKKAKFGPFFK